MSEGESEGGEGGGGGEEERRERVGKGEMGAGGDCYEEVDEVEVVLPDSLDGVRKPLHLEMVQLCGGKRLRHGSVSLPPELPLDWYDDSEPVLPFSDPLGREFSKSSSSKASSLAEKVTHGVQKDIPPTGVFGYGDRMIPSSKRPRLSSLEGSGSALGGGGEGGEGGELQPSTLTSSPSSPFPKLPLPPPCRQHSSEQDEKPLPPFRTEVDGVSVYKCPYGQEDGTPCVTKGGKEYWSCRKSCKEHIDKHFDIERWKCPLCDKSFSQKRLYKHYKKEYDMNTAQVKAEAARRREKEKDGDHS